LGLFSQVAPAHLESLTMRRFVEIMKHNPTPQMSYQVGFCFWLLTFEQEIAEEINKYVPARDIVPLQLTTPRKYDIIPLLTSVAQNAGKEKVIRVIIATFRVRLFPCEQSCLF
jgi:V-type H+-transporting ATPase subunit H